MIPEFPEFKNLELSDKEEIEAFTKQFPPYSDFNFVSMWSWDTNGEMRLSWMHDNLIVRFTDYLTGEPCYSFLGNNNVNETADILLELCKKEGINCSLKFIPQDVIDSFDTKKFRLEEDRDHFDYILDLEKLAAHSGPKFSSKRKLANKLLKHEKCALHVINNIDQKHALLIHDMVQKIENQKTNDMISGSARRELEAVKRMLDLENHFNLTMLCIFLDNELIGFSIKQILNEEYSMGHFLKAHSALSSSAYSLLMQKLASVLLDHGCRYINIEQDMGISGLRVWKNSYGPLHFLKKYKVIHV